MSNIIILYHKDCLDGFGAAWAAWKKFGNKAEYIGVEPKCLPPKLPKNSQVFIIDTSFSPKNTEKLLKLKNEVMVIDHHVSEESDVKSVPAFIFDLKHSGAVLAWNFFHPKKVIPEFLRHVEDYDLWKFKLPHTKEINVFMELLEFDFKIWEEFSRQFENPKKRRLIIEKGNTILQYKNKLIKTIAKKSQLVVFEGIKTLACNAPAIRNEIGNYIVKNLMPPLAVVWSIKYDGKIWFSLYSDGTIDVSKIAKKYGGGGHKGAAGFLLKENQKFPWKKIK